MKKSLFFLTVLAVLLALLPSIAEAANFYASPSGSDSNPGTFMSPFLTAQHLANALSCGDTGYLRTGTYDGGVSFNYGVNTTCSSWASPVTIKAYNHEPVVLINTNQNTIGGAVGAQVPVSSGECPPDTVTVLPYACYAFRDSYSIFEDLIWDGQYGDHNGAGPSVFYADHVKFINNECKNAHNICAGARGDNGVHCAIVATPCPPPGVVYMAAWDRAPADISYIGGSMHDNGGCTTCTEGGGYGAYLSVTDSLVDGVEVYNNRGLGVQFTNSGARKQNNNVLRNSIIHDNRAGAIMGEGTGNKAYNNLFYNNPNDFDLAFDFGCFSCAAYQNTLIGITNLILGTGCQNCIAKNNILAGGGVVQDLGIASVTQANYTASLDPTSGDFTGPGTPDYNYRLKSTSGAIGCSGSSLSSLGISGLLTDILTHTRLDPPSCGAYDYGGIADPSIITVSPVSLHQGDTSQPVTLTGVNVTFDGTSAATTTCTGVSVSGTALLDSLHVTATITVSGVAPIASCNISVSTTGLPTATKTNGFSVTSPLVASISSVTPGTVLQGGSQVLTVVGVNTTFVQGATTPSVTNSTGLTFNVPTVTDATHLTVTITASVSAALGVRTLTFTTVADGAVPAPNSLTVNAPNICNDAGSTIGLVTGQCVNHPLDVNPLTSIITPSLPVATQFVPGHYTLVDSHLGCKSEDCSVTTSVPVSSITSACGFTYAKVAGSATNLANQVEIWIAPVTSACVEHVTVNFGGATVYYSSAFLQEFYGFATSSPFDVSGVAVGTSTAPSVSTSSPTTVANGLMIADIVTGSTVITAGVCCSLIDSFSQNAVEYSTLVATGTATALFATNNNGFNAVVATFKPNVATPASISAVSPNTGWLLTSNKTVTLTGVNTHWGSTTVFSMSDMGGIGLISLAINSATSATVHFSISGGASLTTRDVIMTTGSEVALSPNGFTVTGERETLVNGFTVEANATKRFSGSVLRK